MNIGVLLSGCGVYDGAEVQEAVLTLLAIDELGWNAVCISLDLPQHHVVNHLNGEPMHESRNMLIEAARIARGAVRNLSEVEPADIDALVIPGGFGSAKNFSSWAFEGPDSTILPEVKLFLVNMVNVGKPVVALCVSPVLLAKAFEGLTIHPQLTLGTSLESSPYYIAGFNAGMARIGAVPVERSVREVLVDAENRLICAPCYMMEARISEVRTNIVQALEALKTLL
ncbi:MAG: isoprenoid biosynthesis protein ElbB [Flavobacteriia bacterium]|nr:isoprenoid biosynthesis protein ElbB [Flavobacteriia bacterium]